MTDREEWMAAKEAKQLADGIAARDKAFQDAAKAFGAVPGDFMALIHKLAQNPNLETVLHRQLGLYKAHGMHEAK